MSLVRFLRSYFWAILLAAVLLSALLYKPIVQSSPVARWDDFSGDVVHRSVPDNRWGRPPTYIYQIAPEGDRQALKISAPSFHQVGDTVKVRETIHRNGYRTQEIIP